MHQIINTYFHSLLHMWQYDMEVFSQPWLYWYMVPALGYLLFYFIKWAVVTVPLWLPVTIVIGSLKSVFKKDDLN